MTDTITCPHREDSECPECETIRHFEHEGLPGFEDCFGCKMNRLQLSARSFPDKRRTAPPKVNNSWERGIVRDGRGVPLVDANLEPVGVKEYANNRHKIERDRRRMREQAARTNGE